MLPILFHERRFFPYHVFDHDPPILFSYWGYDLVPLLVSITAVVPPSSPVYLFAMLAWTHETESQLMKAAREYQRYLETFPNVEITLLANTVAEQKKLENLGLRATFCNANSFLDENIFIIHPDVGKRFDAIYNAKLTPFKRHWLAAEIDNLGLVTYMDEDYEGTAEFPMVQSYYDYVRRTLPQATLLNPQDENGSVVVLEPRAVSRCLNQGRVGLCLSAEEGAMLAAVEYLLCGLAVVSTRSLGGREVFWRDDYAIVVEDEPAAVREAVNALATRITPERIREGTLEIMESHRDRLRQTLQRIYSIHGRTVDIQEVWRRGFVNKMAPWQSLDQIARALLST